MVTGDNKDTARAIARQCGLIDDNDKDVLIIEGPKFIELTGGIVCKRYYLYSNFKMSNIWMRMSKGLRNC